MDSQAQNRNFSRVVHLVESIFDPKTSQKSCSWKLVKASWYHNGFETALRLVFLWFGHHSGRVFGLNLLCKPYNKRMKRIQENLWKTISFCMILQRRQFSLEVRWDKLMILLVLWELLPASILDPINFWRHLGGLWDLIWTSKTSLKRDQKRRSKNDASGWPPGGVRGSSALYWG